MEQSGARDHTKTQQVAGKVELFDRIFDNSARRGIWLVTLQLELEFDQTTNTKQLN